MIMPFFFGDPEQDPKGLCGVFVLFLKTITFAMLFKGKYFRFTKFLCKRRMIGYF